MELNISLRKKLMKENQLLKEKLLRIEPYIELGFALFSGILILTGWILAKLDQQAVSVFFYILAYVIGGYYLIAAIISAFSIGAIIFQLPLGLASDRFGRRNVLLFAMLIGSVIFLSASIFEHSAYFLLAAFFIAGMLLGSTYSLSIAFLTDTIPKHLLPAGNLLISICFSLGSISGPFLGGLAIEHLPNISFFFLISCILFLIFFGLAGFKEEKQLPLADQRWNF